MQKSFLNLTKKQNMTVWWHDRVASRMATEILRKKDQDALVEHSAQYSSHFNKK